MTWNDDYFNDRFCGIPTGGYTSLFENLLEGIPVETEADFLSHRERFESQAKKIVYTGPLDRLFDYDLGANDWRGLKFDRRELGISDSQGVAAVNFTDANVPYTRIVEHKHFDSVSTDHTIVTHEYPSNWKAGDEMFYPVNNKANDQLQRQYQQKVPQQYITGGRLASYQYYDMHQVVASAMHTAEVELLHGLHDRQHQFGQLNRSVPMSNQPSQNHSERRAA